MLSAADQMNVFDSVANRVIGWCILCWNSDEHETKVADVTALAVTSRYHRKGIAARLLKYVTVHPALVGFELVLFVDCVNAAGKAFYDAQGWLLVQRPLPLAYHVHDPMEESLPAGRRRRRAVNVFECRRFGG